jgi:hypothetical protein
MHFKIYTDANAKPSVNSPFFNTDFNNKMNIQPLIALAFTLLLLQGCSSNPSINRTVEVDSTARDIGVKSSDIVFVSRCQVAVVQKGIKTGEFRTSICLYAKPEETLYLRIYDVTTGLSSPFRSLKRSDVENVSLNKGTMIDQVQLRTDTEVIAMYMRPDGGLGTNNSQAQELLDLLTQAGHKLVESKEKIDFHIPRVSGSGVATPIIIMTPPKKR